MYNYPEWNSLTAEWKRTIHEGINLCPVHRPLLIPSATTPGDEPVTHFVFGHQVVMVLLEHIQVSSSFLDGFCSLALQERQGQLIGTGESSG